jgi:hypothetical protein
VTVTESWGGLAKKGKKGKKKKDSTPKANKVLQHSIARIGAFGEIGLDAPTALEQIPALLATLAAKMAEYDEKAASMPAKAKKGLSKPRKVRRQTMDSSAGVDCVACDSTRISLHLHPRCAGRPQDPASRRVGPQGDHRCHPWQLESCAGAPASCSTSTTAGRGGGCGLR